MVEVSGFVVSVSDEPVVSWREIMGLVLVGAYYGLMLWLYLKSEVGMDYVTFVLMCEVVG